MSKFPVASFQVPESPVVFFLVFSQIATEEERIDGLLKISRGTAILLLGVYIAYLYFQVRFTTSNIFQV